MKSLSLAWLFPDNFNLHGDRGNILAIQKLCKLNRIDLKIDKIYIESSFKPHKYDMIIMLPGEISIFPIVIESLKPHIISLKNFLNEKKPILVTGSSVALWGKRIIRDNGEVIRGLGILPLEVKENDCVYGDDLYFKANYNDQSYEIIGNQIQMADFNYENKDHHFGVLAYGYGNNGLDCYEGYKLNKGIFTNTLGPLFILNPWLCMEFINVALSNNGEMTVQENFFQIEKKSFEEKKKYIMSKKTNLRSCKGVIR